MGALRDTAPANHWGYYEEVIGSSKVYPHYAGVDQIINILHYNDLSKLLWVAAYILQFINNCKHEC